MTTNEWWLSLIAALVFGAALGAWVTWRVARQQFDTRLRTASDELKQRHAATVEKLRSAQSKAKAELETSRGAFKRQVAVMMAEPKAAQERAEERLKVAYAELDRLRAQAARPADTGPAALVDGFAATRPMREGL